MGPLRIRDLVRVGGTRRPGGPDGTSSLKIGSMTRGVVRLL